jgi:hypothetical protein
MHLGWVTIVLKPTNWCGNSTVHVCENRGFAGILPLFKDFDALSDIYFDRFKSQLDQPFFLGSVHRPPSTYHTHGVPEPVVYLSCHGNCPQVSHVARMSSHVDSEALLTSALESSVGSIPMTKTLL